MIFVTVGTLFPFDRLIRIVDECVGEGLIGDEVFAQTGKSSYQPANFESFAVMDRVDFENKVKQCDALIGHAGMGSITTALQHFKPLMVMPRIGRLGEHVNDHQVDTARKFEELGHVLAANDKEEFIAKLPQLYTFVPKPRKAEPERVAGRIAQFLQSLTGEVPDTQRNAG